MPRIAILMALTLSTCAPRPPATLHGIAEEYVRLTLQFAQHQPSLVETWLGPDDWKPGPRVPVTELHAALDELIAQTARVGNIDRTELARVDYLRRQLGALKVAARRLSGESTRFADEFDALFAGRRLPGEAIDLTDERAALERELPGDGQLADRIAAYRQRYLVPSDRVEAVFTAAIDACRRATASHIQLPSDERVDVAFGAAGDTAGSAEYAGRHQTRVTLASRDGHDVAELLHLACHETYPGHHLQHVLIDDALVRGRGWIEFQLTPAFGAHTMLSEGWAEAGVDLAMPPDVSARVYRDTLLPLAGLRADETERLARIDALAAPFAMEAVEPIGRYLDDEVPREKTLQALGERALILSPERLIALAERRRAVAVVYGPGKRAVTSLVGDADTNGKWRKLHDVFTVTPFVMP